MPLLSRLKPYLIGVPIGLALFVAVAVAAALFPPAGRPVAIYALRGAPAALEAVIAAGGDLLEIRRNVVVAVSDDPRFVARLYRQTALVAVLADGGCGFGRKAPAIVRAAFSL